jgi:hypothetical protein
MHLFNKDWWAYIFAPTDREDESMLWYFKVWKCRWQGHPHGVVWYNTNGLEPDMTCKNCGDDLG